MTDAAADTLLSNSTASLGSIGSTQRSEMPALNPASARSRIASRLREASLGRKPLDSPAAAAKRIKQAVVQPVGAALPELDALRNHAVAAPVRGPKGVLAMAFTGFLHGGLQRGLSGAPAARRLCQIRTPWQARPRWAAAGARAARPRANARTGAPDRGRRLPRRGPPACTPVAARRHSSWHFTQALGAFRG